MPSTPPPGDPAPADGALPDEALEALGDKGFGVYVHVPYCAHRCGYCDFNTYVEDPTGYAGTVLRELALAWRALKDPPPADTVFFGGGTPTLLPYADLGRILAAIDRSPGAEVTVEANPETLDPAYLAGLRVAGATRLSLGMQSVTPHVLATLERRHTPLRAEDAVRWARDAGFDSVSVDLIFGTPGETLDEWGASLDAAVDSGADHVSAYALIVEPGTRLAAQIGRGEIPEPDDDLHADMYDLAEDVLRASGFHWYEISNWARTPADECRHNLLYWRGGDWWGAGPGAHSHVGGVRWWNRRLPADHARAVDGGRSPAQAREVLDAETRRVERVLLGVRLAEGHPTADLTERGRAAADAHAANGLLTVDANRVTLTRPGRLLADLVIRDLVD